MPKRRKLLKRKYVSTNSAVPENSLTSKESGVFEAEPSKSLVSTNVDSKDSKNLLAEKDEENQFKGFGDNDSLYKSIQNKVRFVRARRTKLESGSSQTQVETNNADGIKAVVSENLSSSQSWNMAKLAEKRSHNEDEKTENIKTQLKQSELKENSKSQVVNETSEVVDKNGFSNRSKPKRSAHKPITVNLDSSTIEKTAETATEGYVKNEIHTELGHNADSNLNNAVKSKKDKKSESVDRKVLAARSDIYTDTTLNQKKYSTKEQANSPLTSQTNTNEKVPSLDEKTLRELSQKNECIGAVLIPCSDDASTHTNESNTTGGFIVCCICEETAETSNFSKNRKFGVFLCDICYQTCMRVVKVAEKAGRLSCLSSEGGCCLEEKKGKKICDSCFAVEALTRLEIPDLVYYKIWKAVGEKIKHSVPTCPSVDPSLFRNKGFLVFVSKNGRIMCSKPFKIRARPKETKVKETGNKTGTGTLKRLIPFEEKSLSFTKKARVKQPTRKYEGQVSSPVIYDTHSGVKRSGCRPNTKKIEMGVDNLEDVMIKPLTELNNVYTNGFPVVMIESFPPKPICFLCGSAGLNQLIFCCDCCEPYHPYCVGDDEALELLGKTDGSCDVDSCSPAEPSSDGLLSPPRTPVPFIVERNRSQPWNKWKCYRCKICSVCHKNSLPDVSSSGPRDFIVCISCKRIFHNYCISLSSSGQKMDLDDSSWTCLECLCCKSCRSKIPSSKKSYTVTVTENGRGWKVKFCGPCLKKREKGAFCPACNVCYDDDDYDTKMMECARCQRWIHAACEGIGDEEYYLLGVVPSTVDYVCKICDPQDFPVWLKAVHNELRQGLKKIMQIFESNAIIGTRKPKRLDFCSGVDEHVSTQNISNVDKTEEASVKGSISSIVMKDIDLLRREWVTDEDESEDKRIKSTHSDADVFCKFYSPAKRITLLTEELSKKFIEIPLDTRPTYRGVTFFKNSALRLLKKMPGPLKRIEELETLLIEAVNKTFPWFYECNLDSKLADSDNIEKTELSKDMKQGNELNLQRLPPMSPMQLYKDVMWNKGQEKDERQCILCRIRADRSKWERGRLICIGLRDWIHVNCAIWSSQVWEREDGALQEVSSLYSQGLKTKCNHCGEKGATVFCCNSSCRSCYHFMCAREGNCALLINGSVFCPRHHSFVNGREIQTHFAISRRVYADVSAFSRKEERVYSSKIKIFIGALRIDKLGEASAISLQNSVIVPKGYQCSRLLWCPASFSSKKIYDFQTLVENSFSKLDNLLSNSNFTEMNFSIDHSLQEKELSVRLSHLEKFFQWIDSAPIIIDEHLYERQIPCPVEFVYDSYEFDAMSSGDDPLEEEIEMPEPDSLFLPEFDVSALPSPLSDDVLTDLANDSPEILKLEIKLSDKCLKNAKKVFEEDWIFQIDGQVDTSSSEEEDIAPRRCLPTSITHPRNERLLRSKTQERKPSPRSLKATCTICSKSFVSKASLSRHLSWCKRKKEKLDHEQRSNFSSHHSIGDQVSKQHTELPSQSVHTPLEQETGPVKCGVCKMTYRTKSSFDRHLINCVVYSSDEDEETDDEDNISVCSTDQEHTQRFQSVRDQQISVIPRSHQPQTNFFISSSNLPTENDLGNTSINTRSMDTDSNSSSSSSSSTSSGKYDFQNSEQQPNASENICSFVQTFEDKVEESSSCALVNSSEVLLNTDESETNAKSEGNPWGIILPDATLFPVSSAPPIQRVLTNDGLKKQGEAESIFLNALKTPTSFVTTTKVFGNEGNVVQCCEPVMTPLLQISSHPSANFSEPARIRNEAPLSSIIHSLPKETLSNKKLTENHINLNQNVPVSVGSNDQRQSVQPTTFNLTDIVNPQGTEYKAGHTPSNLCSENFVVENTKAIPDPVHTVFNESNGGQNCMQSVSYTPTPNPTIVDQSFHSNKPSQFAASKDRHVVGIEASNIELMQQFSKPYTTLPSDSLPNLPLIGPISAAVNQTGLSNFNFDNEVTQRLIVSNNSYNKSALFQNHSSLMKEVGLGATPRPAVRCVQNTLRPQSTPHQSQEILLNSNPTGMDVGNSSFSSESNLIGKPNDLTIIRGCAQEQFHSSYPIPKSTLPSAGPLTNNPSFILVQQGQNLIPIPIVNQNIQNNDIRPFSILPQPQQLQIQQQQNIQSQQQQQLHPHQQQRFHPQQQQQLLPQQQPQQFQYPQPQQCHHHQQQPQQFQHPQPQQCHHHQQQPQQFQHPQPQQFHHQRVQQLHQPQTQHFRLQQAHQQPQRLQNQMPQQLQNQMPQQLQNQMPQQLEYLQLQRFNLHHQHYHSQQQEQELQKQPQQELQIQQKKTTCAQTNDILIHHNQNTIKDQNSSISHVLNGKFDLQMHHIGYNQGHPCPCQMCASKTSQSSDGTASPPKKKLKKVFSVWTGPTSKRGPNKTSKSQNNTNYSSNKVVTSPLLPKILPAVTTSLSKPIVPSSNIAVVRPMEHPLQKISDQISLIESSFEAPGGSINLLPSVSSSNAPVISSNNQTRNPNLTLSSSILTSPSNSATELPPVLDSSPKTVDSMASSNSKSSLQTTTSETVPEVTEAESNQDVQKNSAKAKKSIKVTLKRKEGEEDYAIKDIKETGSASGTMRSLKIKAKITSGERAGTSTDVIVEPVVHSVPTADPNDEAFPGGRTVDEAEADKPVSSKSSDGPDAKKSSSPKLMHRAVIVYEVKCSDEVLYRSSDVRSVWSHIFETVQGTRLTHNLPPLSYPSTDISSSDPNFNKQGLLSAFNTLGLTHHAVKFLLEQLPGVKAEVRNQNAASGYIPDFNSSGSARTEGYHQRKEFDMFGWLTSKHREAPSSVISSDESKTLNLPIAMRFRNLKGKASKMLFVRSSKIHGRGLYSLKEFEKGEMLIEYAGEVIRSSLCDLREKYYGSKGIGCYMFRIDDDLVVDATMKGNAARFINHSCEPNCESKSIKILGKRHIIIFALRKINYLEELTYDYKFNYEDDKLPCTCGSRKCRKYLN